MHLLVTGGTGLIGSAFIRKFHTKYQFTVLTRDTDHARLPKSVNLINSLTSLPSLDGFDAVINLQGEPIFGKRWSHQQKKELEQSRVFVTQTLSALIQKSAQPPKCFLSGSAIGFYGRQANDVVIDESNGKPFREFSHQLCKKWEKAALSAHHHTRVCLLRTGIVLSERGGALAEMLPTFKLGLGAVMASGEQMMSWIHIDDMVDAIDYLIHNDNLSGPVNLTAPTPVSNRVFSNALAKALNKPCFLTLPAFIANLMLGEASDLICFGQHVIPKQLTDKGFAFQYANVEEALSSLVSD